MYDTRTICQNQLYVSVFAKCNTLNVIYKSNLEKHGLLGHPFERYSLIPFPWSWTIYSFLTNSKTRRSGAA